MSFSNTTPSLYKALKAEGYELPEECVDVELLMPVDSTYKLRFLVNVTDERLAQLGRALTRIGEKRVGQ